MVSLSVFWTFYGAICTIYNIIIKKNTEIVSANKWKTSLENTAVVKKMLTLENAEDIRDPTSQRKSCLKALVFNKRNIRGILQCWTLKLIIA